jgi:predicted 3-demethylubiquinone-9 3-methyltransferase (glyoxalase superfamily)
MSSTIYPCLWFDGKAKQAAEFYKSVFPSFKLHSENPMVIIFEINGTKIMGLNGGPNFTFSEAISLVVECKDQHEIDYFWEKLSQDGRENRCGWLKDKFGLSWQIIPSDLGKLMSNPETAPKVGKALMPMIKIDIATLYAAIE